MSEQPEPEAAPAKKPVRRGRIAAVVAFALLAVAVVGGAGYTVVTVQNADRDPGAPTWKFPKPAKAKEGAGDKGAKGASSLAAMLLPFGTDGWRRGPDIAEFGSDAALSGREAAALRKESLRGLPRSQRRELEKRIDKQHTRGMAMRSYMSTDASGAGDADFYKDSTFTVSVELVQIQDKAAVRNMSTFQNGFLAALKIFRKGPEIPGHKNAKCFLPPAEAKKKLDVMLCSAYRGDVLVTATAYGAEPLHTKEIVGLLREQLDRIAEPGEAV
ncbi:hypothetical protein [Streptomyces sp. HUAS TT20]|uniref:hypothetical protein n=1 Tax=Streptomyces sp. HUAS TT20 TaxID=3447509 RepID=UPI0021DAAB43|nr:hypothetical protein [Streptomyces sp. HUAS 15-9]UXY28413.1 hypothetical protein N8I87_18740 [Streptomyces sp. HUAS 15-9]